jgi:hypothetical protein
VAIQTLVVSAVDDYSHWVNYYFQQLVIISDDLVDCPCGNPDLDLVGLFSDCCAAIIKE